MSQKVEVASNHGSLYNFQPRPKLSIIGEVGALVYLKLHCLMNLNSMCPTLKELWVDMYKGTGEEGEPLQIFHETLEKIELSQLSHCGVRLTCPQLKILILDTTGVHWRQIVPTSKSTAFGSTEEICRSSLHF